MTNVSIEHLAAHPDFRRFALDGEPMWMEGRHRDRPAQSALEARAELRKLVRLLRLQEIPKSMQLATRLENAPSAPNAASPVFMRTFQRFCTYLFYEALIHSRSSRFSVVSVIHRDCGVPMDYLDPTVFVKLGKRVHEALRMSGVTCALGGFDLSANEHEHAEFRSSYWPQVWFLAPTNEIRGGERMFRRCFPKGFFVHRPVLIKPWDYYLGAIAYALKPKFNRRISLSAGNTRMCELRVFQKCEIAHTMAMLNPLSRLFLHNFSIEAGKQVKPGIGPEAFQLACCTEPSMFQDSRSPLQASLRIKR